MGEIRHLYTMRRKITGRHIILFLQYRELSQTECWNLRCSIQSNTLNNSHWAEKTLVSYILRGPLRKEVLRSQAMSCFLGFNRDTQRLNKV